MMPKTKPKKECEPCESPGSWPLKTIPEPSSKQSQNHQGHYDTPPGPSGPVADYLIAFGIPATVPWDFNLLVDLVDWLFG